MGLFEGFLFCFACRYINFQDPEIDCFGVVKFLKSSYFVFQSYKELNLNVISLSKQKTLIEKVSGLNNYFCM